MNSSESAEAVRELLKYVLQVSSKSIFTALIDVYARRIVSVS